MSDADSGWEGLFVVVIVIGLVLWLLYAIVSFLYENVRTIVGWLGPFVLVVGNWYGLRAIHYLTATHPATAAVKRRSVTDAARFLCTNDKGGLKFMHENQAKNARKLCQEVETENAHLHREIANLQAELKRLGDVHAGSAAEAIAAVQSSRHNAELRRALIRRLAEEEGMHVSR